jgi:glycosyltransferase involved in cell wall biosynthesis
MNESNARGLVIVPTYNECETVAHAIERLFAAGDDVHLLVVDDHSPDGTADIVRGLSTGHPGAIHLLERKDKRGLGSAYVDGFRWAIEHGYPAVVEMDADGSHDPAVVPKLLDALEKADLSIGSRYVDGGGVRNWSRGRQILSAAGNRYARILLGFHVRDSTSGFRAYRAEMIGHLLAGTIRSEGYAFQVEMTRRVRNYGGTIVEIPIIFEEREAGRSKMSRRIVLEAIVSIAAWGLKDRVLTRRKRSHLRA